ncbi:Serine/threonine protein kinase [Sterolibacterium denitrificans]|uniref:Serine/threonine protein kinase n=2 Tax=Sterolibacterium denitrificans TaxID=157592 RepID=A0A7Z7HNP5_9PROT|nr:serine/threonine-protein kinase [Sterolibacterium denitrificans]KYC28859.1 serine/threonine protein kinase [Sterolibacterium denitrificans]SMB21151.1 Serine/threonine protein kinase [Sterolibacterium denitrificans]
MERIGKYEIRARIGEGTTATVYLGFDSFNQREVAIKLLRGEILQDAERSAQYRRMLLNEASLAGRLQHPHIVQIFDAVVDEEQSYIVMEYVPGCTLEQYIHPSRLLPLERLVEIIFKCTRALDYAYTHGVTHRDIKPANILLVQTSDGAPGGDIRISDFGAALQADAEGTQVSGVGSPAYMSPQQIRDLPLDHRTDIYSLGVVMYQLLTGQLPFKAANHYAMLHQILNAEVLPPSSYRSEIPPSLDAIVARAMQKETSARYADWSEFARDLTQAFRNRQQQARRQEFPDSEKFESLRALPFFHEFSDVEIWEVLRFSTWREVAPDTVIMKDGEAGDFFCFLLAGELDVAKHGHSLNRLQAGACFGEMAIIDKHSNSTLRGADVVAKTTATLVTIQASALHHATAACRMHFYQAFLEVLADRLNEANIKLTSV